MASDDDFKLGLQLAEAQNQVRPVLSLYLPCSQYLNNFLIFSFNLQLDFQWLENNPPPPLVVQPLEIHSNNDNIIQGKRQRRRPVRLQDEATVQSKKRDLTVLISSSSTTTATATSKKDGRGRKPGAMTNVRHQYDTQDKIDELERDRNDFIHQRDVLQNKISVADFLVGKPHSNSRFHAYVAKDENKRAALPTLENSKRGLTKGQTRVISVADENSFVEEHKHLDATKVTKGREKVTAESNPIAFAFAKKFSHLTRLEKKNKVHVIRKKILKEQEKERAAEKAAAALPPPVLNDDDSDWA